MALSCQGDYPTESAATLAVASRGIFQGTFDTDDEFPGVALIQHGEKPLCSAVKVAPGWLLSAAHCLYPHVNGGHSSEPAEETPDAYRIFFGADGDQPSEGYTVQAVYAHPRFGPWDTGDFRFDLALWRFDDDDVFPAYCWRGHPELSEPVDYRELKAEVAMVGYGAMLWPPGSELGHRQKIRASLDWICNDSDGCHIGPGYDWIPEGTLGTFDVDRSGHGPHTGDSGGPIFLFGGTAALESCRQPAVVVGVYSHRPYPWGPPGDPACDGGAHVERCESQPVAFVKVDAAAEWVNGCVLGESCPGQVLPR